LQASRRTLESQVEAFTAQAKSELDTVLQQLQLQKQRVADRDQQLRDARKSVARLTDEVDRLRDASDEAARSHAAELQALQSRCDAEWHARYSNQAVRNQQEVQSLKATINRMHAQLQAVSEDKMELQVLRPTRCCAAFPAITPHPAAGASLQCQPRAFPPQVIRNSADKRRPGVTNNGGVAQAGSEREGIRRHPVTSRDFDVQVERAEINGSLRAVFAGLQLPGAHAHARNSMFHTRLLNADVTVKKPNLNPVLILAVLGDVPHPLDLGNKCYKFCAENRIAALKIVMRYRRVVALLNDLQEAHLKTTRGEHWYLKNKGV